MFDRWKCEWHRTWAYRIFKKHHTQLNSFYWAHLSASNNSLRIAKGQLQHSPVATIFPVPINDKGRKNNTVEEWTSDYKEFMNWVRLSAAVSLNSYLEIYLQSVVALALESDPGVLWSAPRSIDGIKLLKAKDGYSFADQSVAVVKGMWQSRLKTYEGYFGNAPDTLGQSINELDLLRDLRNDVSHTFGREIKDYKGDVHFELKPLQRLSADRLKKWFQMIDGVVAAIDDHLRVAHVGAYEALRHYHVWARNYKLGPIRKEVAFKKHINATLGSNLKRQYFKELIAYYDDLWVVSL